MQSIDRTKTLNALTHFLHQTLDASLSAGGDPAELAVDLFHKAAHRVPAYREWLGTQNVVPASVATPADFAYLPLITKTDYLRAYPLPARCWDGNLAAQEMLAVSSGSTGVPLFWPRTLQHELDVAVRFEQVLRDAFHAHDRSTLAIVCFAMGTWVGGMFTAQCCRLLALKGYPLTLVTPGNNKREIFRVVAELGPDYDQVVLLGYPPFIKDVVDSGLAEGLDWSALDCRVVTAGEVFSEEWRNLLCDRLGRPDPAFATASLYGTADAGVLGNETPLSVRIRQLLAKHPQAARKLFGESRLPTLVQYDPKQRYFEVVDATLVVTADTGAPLIRYHIADRGGVLAYEAMRDFVHTLAPDLFASTAHRALPFVYVFGRADFTVSFFGANIYPENIAVGLEQSELHDEVSGKFVLQVAEAVGNRRPELLIHVELLPSRTPSNALAEQIALLVLRELLRINSEFAHYVPPEFQRPRVTLCPFGDPDYFPLGVKHRYTRKPVPNDGV